MRKHAEIFKALSDETRIKMLALLLKYDELCVCDFVEVLNISQSKASRHLRYLRNAGLLDDRRDGVWVYYRVHPRAGSSAKNILEAIHDMILSIMPKTLDKEMKQWIARKARHGNSCSGTSK